METARDPRPTEVPGRGRNWFALAGLWTLGTAWIVAIGVVYYAELLDHDVSENVGWALLAVGTVGFVLTLAGFTTARTHGDTTVAWAALALALAAASFVGGPFLLYGFVG